MIVHAIKRIIALGPYKSSQRIVQKVKDQVANYYWKRKAYQGTATHSWQAITHTHDYIKTIDQFRELLHNQKLSFIDTLYQDQISEKEIIEQADLFASNCFNLLGSQQQCFSIIPWHQDFRLHVQDPNADNCFEKDLFCKSRPILIGTTEKLTKDIKIPWELSRFYQFFVLGKAFYITNDVRYGVAAHNHLADWLDQNPYLFGINWMCPMEVGLRAVNWIIGFDMLKKNMPQELVERIICSLYDHLVYLEHNWEIYDGRTSNHYLSDLIGYFYLCWFFKDLPGFIEKREWCYYELLREWDKQVFDEGTDYEGSTAYHRLVTEIFYHFSLLCTEFQLVLPDHYQTKLKRMVEFIEWCTPVNGALITIGDNDSGRVLWYGLPRQVIQNTRDKQEGVKYYKQFGLSLIKTNLWHVTLRHHSYATHQPSGHYHADVGSVTVSMNGVMLFADPGSYLYTPSAYWRNYFRAFGTHNSFYMINQEPITVDNQLFFLNIPKNQSEQLLIKEQKYSIAMHHNLYQSKGLQAVRLVVLEADNQLIIRDRWDSTISQLVDTTWHFTVGPEMTIEENGTTLICFHKNKAIGKIESDLVFEIEQGWFSHEYGSKVVTQCLKARKHIYSSQEIVIQISRIE